MMSKEWYEIALDANMKWKTPSVYNWQLFFFFLLRPPSPCRPGQKPTSSKAVTV